MAKKSKIEHNCLRQEMSKRWKMRRDALKVSRNLSIEENFSRSIKLAALPRNGASSRVRLRCEVTGRPRGVYRYFRISRIALRDMALVGEIPGVHKASW